MQHITPPAKSVRQSNLELLRIVSMFLVLLIHYMPTRMMASPDTLRLDFWNTIGQFELSSICFVCVNCFVLISGYFGIKWKAKSFSKLIYNILFWGIIAYAASVILSRYVVPPTQLYGNSFIYEAFNPRWFIGAYLCLYIVSPIINAYIDKCTNAELGKYLLTFYIFSTIFGWILKLNNFNEGMSELSLVGLYAVGAYLRKTELKIFSYKAWTNLWIFLGLGFALVIVNTLVFSAGINKSLYGYLNPIVILQAIYLFLFFKNLNIGYLPCVNVIAASAFSVYLFHDHSYIFPYYTQLGKWMNENSFVPLLSMIGVIALIFLFCTIIDSVGHRLFDIGFKLITKSHQRKGIAQTGKL